MKYPISNPFIALTSTRYHGHSKAPFDTNNVSYIVGDEEQAVEKNREKIARQYGIPLSQWVFVRQCHSDKIKKVTKQDAGRGTKDFESGIEDVDAIYTFEPNIMLAFQHADCVPVLIYDETTNLVAAIHAGWQGTLKEITRKSIEYILEHENVQPKNLKVIIGPCLSFESSQIDLKEVKTEYELNKNIQLDKNQMLKINAAQLNIEQCLACGIPEENIVRFDMDTYSNPEKFFSYQRDNQTGRHVSAIGRVDTTQ